jgi:hypothetical protein
MEETDFLCDPAALLPRKEPPVPIGLGLGPRSRSGRSDPEKNPCLCWESNPARPAHGLVTIMSQLPQLLTRSFNFNLVVCTSVHTVQTESCFGFMLCTIRFLRSLCECNALQVLIGTSKCQKPLDCVHLPGWLFPVLDRCHLSRSVSGICFRAWRSQPKLWLKLHT